MDREAILEELKAWLLEQHVIHQRNERCLGSPYAVVLSKVEELEEEYE
jgi:hypothetical protein